MRKIALLCFAALFACILMLHPVCGFARQENAAEQTIDLDLSPFSGTMVYAQIYQMAAHPEDYMGKIIRLSGWYDVFTDSETGLTYTVCYIPDATACCVQGIEFIWAGEHSLPEDYPEPGAEIVVTGRFETYFEGDWEYMRLADAQVVWQAE